MQETRLSRRDVTKTINPTLENMCIKEEGSCFAEAIDNNNPPTFTKNKTADECKAILNDMYDANKGKSINESHRVIVGTKGKILVLQINYNDTTTIIHVTDMTVDSEQSKQNTNGKISFTNENNSLGELHIGALDLNANRLVAFEKTYRINSRYTARSKLSNKEQSKFFPNVYNKNDNKIQSKVSQAVLKPKATITITSLKIDNTSNAKATFNINGVDFVHNVASLDKKAQSIKLKEQVKYIENKLNREEKQYFGHILNMFDVSTCEAPLKNAKGIYTIGDTNASSAAHILILILTGSAYLDVKGIDALIQLMNTEYAVFNTNCTSDDLQAAQKLQITHLLLIQNHIIINTHTDRLIDGDQIILVGDIYQDRMKISQTAEDGAELPKMQPAVWLLMLLLANIQQPQSEASKQPQSEASNVASNTGNHDVKRFGASFGDM